MNVLFVCTGNTCRSPMAEYIFRKMLRDTHRQDIEVHSCGVAAFQGMQVPDPVRQLMRAEGVDITLHRPQPITAQAVQAADLILAMDQTHREIIEALYPDARSKTFLLKTYVQAGGSQTSARGGGSGAVENKTLADSVEIRDPIGQSADGYRRCLDEITTCLKRLQERFPPPSDTTAKETLA